MVIRVVDGASSCCPAGASHQHSKKGGSCRGMTITPRSRLYATAATVVVVALMLPAIVALVMVAPSSGYDAIEVGIIAQAHAQEQQESVSVSSVAVGTTTLLSITNNGGESAQGISTIRIWLGASDESVFKSFKTENGWVGQKTPENVIIFTAAIPLRDGETAKLGVETDNIISGINWRAVDQNGDDVGTGKSVPGAMQEPVVPPPVDDEIVPPVDDPPTPTPPEPAVTVPSITDESDFRIIPAKPSVGSTIRVAGEKFGPDREYRFYIDGRILGSFASDSDGRFVATVSIPSDASPDRVSFAVRDAEGQEVIRSLRLNAAEHREQSDASSGTGEQSPQGSVSIADAPETARIGDRITMHGTGVPGSTVVVYMTGPDGMQIRADVIQADHASGAWSVPGAHLVGADSKVGIYSTTVTDGNNIAQTAWSVIQEKKSTLESTKIAYDRGETMSFVFASNQSDAPVRVDLEDPKGHIVYSNIAHPGANGTTHFEYKTDFGNEEGTYTLVATQGEDKEFLFVGLGQMPSSKIRLELDGVNYRSTDTAIIDIVASPTDTLKLTILDDTDNIVHSESIRIQSDGRMVISLDLTGFDNGIYTAEIEKGTEKTSREFTVGLQSGSTNIEITPISPPYLLGEQFSSLH